MDAGAGRIHRGGNGHQHQLQQANARERDLKDELAELKKHTAGCVTFKELFEANKAREAAEAELARLKADSARIDWLQKYWVPQEKHAVYEMTYYAWGRWPANLPDLRAAVDVMLKDAAMLSGGEGASQL